MYEKIIQYIDANIKNNITIEELSNVARYSQAQIYRLFKVYSPVPVMEYIRRKRLYYAANELYNGRNLLEIALDYGYETPAGFYKAFKNVFGCAPSRYKNNKSRRNVFMNIDNVKSVEELNEIFGLMEILYPNHYPRDENEKYSRKWWIGEYERNPELLLYAKDDGKICGFVFGWADGGSITVGGDKVLDEYKNKGIHEALFIEIEKRAAKHNFDGIGLGIEEGEEEFYAKLGYTGDMLIQSEKHNVDELLKHLETLDKKYEILGTSVYDGYINQIWLRVSILDKEVKKSYEEMLGDCWTQIIVSKRI